MSLLRVRVLGSVSHVGGGVDLGLEARLDDVERTCDNAGEASGCRTGEQLQWHTDVTALFGDASPCLKLLPEHELKGGKGKVAIKSGFVAVEERQRTFGANDGASGVDGATVIVAGLEVRIIVSTLELQSCFQNLRRDVDNRRSEIAKES